MLLFNSYNTENSTATRVPTICVFLKIIAWLNLIGGIIVSFFFFNHQYEFQTITAPSVTQPLIVPGIACIVAGAIGMIIFWAFSEVIVYLSAINENIYLLKQQNRKTSEIE